MFKKLVAALFVGTLLSTFAVATQGNVYAQSHHHHDTQVTATAPTQVPPTCVSNGSYTISSVTGVEYEVKNGWRWDHIHAGTYDVTNRFDSTVQIRANARDGYELVGTDNWTLRFYAPNCNVTATEVQFTAPTCTAQGTYTIPVKEGVDYKVGGVVKAAGTYTAENGTIVTVTAVAKGGYKLVGEATWTNTFTAPTNCETPIVPVTPVTPSTPVATPAAAVVTTTPTSLPNTGSDASVIALATTGLIGFALVTRSMIKRFAAQSV